MKTNTMKQYNYYAYHRTTPAKYPNSRSTLNDLRNRIVDSLLAAAISLAFVVVVLFLLVL